MVWSKPSQENIEKMRSKMHKGVDTFCDKVEPEEVEQVHIGLKELEISFNEAVLDTIVAHCENNQGSTPLLLEQQQELRNRVCPGQKPGPEQDSEPEGSHNQSPGAQKPGESFCEWVLRLFQEMLSRLQKTWQDVLPWVQEKWASLVNMVKFILTEIKNFCSGVAQSFSSLLKVQGVP